MPDDDGEKKPWKKRSQMTDEEKREDNRKSRALNKQKPMSFANKESFLRRKPRISTRQASSSALLPFHINFVIARAGA